MSIGNVRRSGHAPTGRPAAVASGDETAFEKFYDRVAGMIFSTARALLCDRIQAEEATQEILVQLWREAGRFSPDRGDALAWAMTLAHRHLIECLRSAPPRTRREAPFAPPVARLVDAAADLTATNEECRRLHRALGQLTAVQREMIMLAYFRGLTCAEIGHELDLVPDTVPPRLHDALIHLRDRLGVIP